jgi:hypothetical protein
MLTFFCCRRALVVGWAICQPGGHSVVNGSFTIDMISFIIF